MGPGNVLARGVQTVDGKHAGLAETCEIVRAGLEGQIPGVRAASSISTTDPGSLLRWAHVLDLEPDRHAEQLSRLQETIREHEATREGKLAQQLDRLEQQLINRTGIAI